MIKLLFLIIFFFLGTFSLKAEDALENDQEFMKALDNTKSPFEDGLPRQINFQPIQTVPKPIVQAQPEVVAPPEVVSLPSLDLQGVIVGEDIHQAIIDGQVVPLQGYIKGARVDSVTKEGVGLLYKGKKFFLKVD